MTALEKYLTSISEGMKKLGAKACFDEFMLRNGRSFMGRPLPVRYRMRMPKMCYWNTYRLVTKSKTLGVPNLELWYQIDPGFKELAEP